jgi:hypothetical protein
MKVPCPDIGNGSNFVTHPSCFVSGKNMPTSSSQRPATSLQEEYLLSTARLTSSGKEAMCV